MINTRIHGIIDYLTGALLIVAPYLFGFATGGIEQWLPQLIGGSIIVMSLLTRYELSVAKVVPLKAHLAVDLLTGILLAASPWLFNFADRIWWPHLLVGLAEVAVVAMTKRRPETDIRHQPQPSYSSHPRP
ncbi:SPW repeat domain-containing protein [Acuticoccus sp.]|uniref:SPW repeat domain-containing protein n=1 Tax=Acuticoccus sp. TaxID=1904378 RepID=UPI003B52B5BD